MPVKVLNVEANGRIKLSRRAAIYEGEEGGGQREGRSPPPQQRRDRDRRRS